MLEYVQYANSKFTVNKLTIHKGRRVHFTIFSPISCRKDENEIEYLNVDVKTMNTAFSIHEISSVTNFLTDRDRYRIVTMDLIIAKHVL